MKLTAFLKTLLLAIAVIFTTTVINAQSNLGVGTASPDASAKLDITSTNQGILVPRMTTTARTGIAAPAKGLMVYDSTVKAFYYHNGTAWGQVGGGAPSTTAMPNYFAGHTSFTTGPTYTTPLTNTSSGPLSSTVCFIVPSAATFTIIFYSYDDEPITFELFGITAVATSNTYTTAGTALATCNTAAWASGAPISSSFTYSATAGQLLTLKSSKTGGGNFTNTGGYFTAFSAN